MARRQYSVRELSDFCIGETVLNKLHNAPPGYAFIWGRPTRMQTAARPGDLWPELWRLMSTKHKEKAVEDWRVKPEQVNAARSAEDRWGGRRKTTRRAAMR